MSFHKEKKTNFPITVCSSCWCRSSSSPSASLMECMFCIVVNDAIIRFKIIVANTIETIEKWSWSRQRCFGRRRIGSSYSHRNSDGSKESWRLSRKCDSWSFLESWEIGSSIGTCQRWQWRHSNVFAVLRPIGISDSTKRIDFTSWIE